MAQLFVDHRLAAARIDPAVGQRGPHHSKIARGDPQTALPGVQIERKIWFAAQQSAGAEQLDRGPVDQVGVRRARIDLVVDIQFMACEAGQPVGQAPPLLLARSGQQACGGDSTRIDHRIRPAIRATLDSGQRVEGHAGGVDADAAARLVRPQVGEHQSEDERFRDAHDREQHVRVSGGEDSSIDRGHADAEQIWIGPGESRVYLRGLAVGTASVPLVRLIDQFGDAGSSRQVACRNEPRSVAGVGVLRHGTLGG
ncbi:hypothetical protein SDC9_71885 [bioreactor metagenome]|uniref:Uncharacterized protein n=1 Tax=bioreactor metagenome TaxID=1076179 RepID=A0A644YH04_9ZZZZ